MCGLRSKSHSCRSTCRTHCYISELFSDDDSEADTDADDDIDEMTVDEEEDLEKDRQAALEALVPGISSSEYGKMPSSFHRNSQRVSRNTAEREEPQPFDGAAGPSLPRKLRQPLLPRDAFEGVDSDDETDDEVLDSEEEEEKPQVVGEIEIDMEEEQDEFLEFARHALGMTDEQWRDIVKERKDRGGMCLYIIPVHRLNFTMP